MLRYAYNTVVSFPNTKIDLFNSLAEKLVPNRTIALENSAPCIVLLLQEPE